MRRASQKLLDDWTVLGQSKRWEKNFHFFVREKAKVGLTCVVERRRRGGRECARWQREIESAFWGV
jgi:hypothetical protein